MDGTVRINIENDPEGALANSDRAIQYLYVSEPVGHSIALDDECFLSLRDALERVSPSSPKDKWRRLKRYRRSTVSWILSTHELSGKWGKKLNRKHPEIRELLKTYPQVPKIYTRKK